VVWLALGECNLGEEEGEAVDNGGRSANEQKVRSRKGEGKEKQKK
jgi:hypothetical protein